VGALMDLSQRLLKIEELIPSCCCLADVGTDHAYIPILAISKGKCLKAIATDINKGPVNKAAKNIREHLMVNSIQTRLGPGLSVLKEGEAETIVIAGMGGNMISDILSQDIQKAKSAKTIILQPMTHQDVLRETLSILGFHIVDEELVKEDRRYYQIIKASSGKGDIYSKKTEYLLGLKLIEKKHPLLKEYITYYKGQLNKVLERIDSKEQRERYIEVSSLICEMEEIEKWL
jgi:tRNA (adenine22-N1)-methyltransferase